MTRALYITTPIPDDLDTPEKNRRAIQAACVVEGRCPACGAIPELARDTRPELAALDVMHLTFRHEPDCPGGAA
jgi:hypothetical protein